MKPSLKCAISFSAAALAGIASQFLPRTAAATPDDLFNRFFSNVLDGRPCYARTYDEKHLKAHSAQRVQRIEIDLSKNNSDGTPNTSDRFELGFALMLTTSPEWYGQAASCKTGALDFECFLEADGGLFRLTPTNGGGLRLTTGETGLALEGSDAVELSGKSGEDRVFDLVPSKEECEAATIFFERGNE
jgi:hypothetical protein